MTEDQQQVMQELWAFIKSEKARRYLQLCVTLSHHGIVDPLFAEQAIYEKVQQVQQDPEMHEFEECDQDALEGLRTDLIYLEAGWLGVLDSDAV